MLMGRNGCRFWEGIESFVMRMWKIARLCSMYALVLYHYASHNPELVDDDAIEAFDQSSFLLSFDKVNGTKTTSSDM